MKFAVRSENVLTPVGIINATVLIENGRIISVEEYNFQSDCEIIDYGKLTIIPGLVDTHVHINEPGREHWEGFETATKSAAAGGITMIVDMPLNSAPVTVDEKSLRRKIIASRGKLFVDCGFYGGIIPGNENKLLALAENGVLGFKAFMVHSGIDDFPNVNENDLRKALEILRNENERILPLLVHAELDLPELKKIPFRGYSSFLKSRPKAMENEAIKLLISLSREFNYPVHIVHLSSSDAIDFIAKAKSEGLKITTETCPHYLTFTSEEIPENDTRFKCTPPIRESENREKLWEAVKNGIIDFIVSDHSPCNPELKFINEGNFEKAWGGISSLQLGLSVVWTEARQRNLRLEEVVKLMSTNTSAFIGLENRKGKIEKGYDADIVIFDPEKKIVVNDNILFHKHKVTPYAGRGLYGSVEATYLRGNKIYDSGGILNGAKGQSIIRN